MGAERTHAVACVSEDEAYFLAMNFLALDIGRKHTGVSFADARVNVAIPLDTIHHTTPEELIQLLEPIIKIRNISEIVVGMPYLMNGTEGEEAEWVHGVLSLMNTAFPACVLTHLDERETSRIFHGAHSTDRHAEAAVRILTVFLERRRS